ncbi:MAG: hypothetical protein ACYT04_39700 [Nostoc sp.]
MKLPSLSHNSKPDGNSDKYYIILQFWQRLGLHNRKNKHPEALEHFLSFPNQDPVGRVFKVGEWIGIRFFSDFEKISPKLKGGQQQPDFSGLRVSWLYSLLLSEFLQIPEAHILIKPDGFAVFNGENLNVLGGRN